MSDRAGPYFPAPMHDYYNVIVTYTASAIKSIATVSIDILTWKPRITQRSIGLTIAYCVPFIIAARLGLSHGYSVRRADWLATHTPPRY